MKTMKQANKKAKKQYFLLSLFACFFVCLFFCLSFLMPSNKVLAVTSLSDVVKSSGPSATSSHVITFLVTADIPPLGKIVIIPEVGDFFIPAGFDYSDVDLATSSLLSGPFVDREIASSSTAVLDGVSVVDASTSGNVTITLNSTYGIKAGTYVQIELGEVADYGEIGNLGFINPAIIGSYYVDVRTLNVLNGLIKKNRAMMAVVIPITMSADFGKTRTEGAPSGYLSYGTTQTVLSLVSNYVATCRYSQIASTSYDDMTNEFAYTTGPSVFHSVLVTGLDQTSTSNFYVRCEDEGGLKDDVTDCVYQVGGSATTTIATTCVDYLISFNISSVENADDNETGTPGPSGGGIGGGGGGGIGNDRGHGTGKLLPYPPLPTNPGVAFTGYAYPNVGVVYLQDGTEVGTMAANADAEFGAFLPDLIQGVYTFSLWADDKNGVRSETYSTTFWIDEGTQTVVSDIFLPPTISANTTTLDIGNSLEMFGQSVPGSTVEVWLYPGQGSEINEAKAIKAQSIADIYGNWAVSVNTSGIDVGGEYSVSARSTVSETVISDWGKALSIILGGEPQITSACAGADLNQDGRVNITDFSILLYYWNTDNACADQNSDGNVDLTDFSIMLYYWTG